MGFALAAMAAAGMKITVCVPSVDAAPVAPAQKFRTGDREAARRRRQMASAAAKAAAK